MTPPSLPKLTLYRLDSGCSLVTHILLEELRLPYTEVKLIFGANHKLAAADGSFTHDDYTQTIHPSGLIPALKIEDGNNTITILTENLAILTYLADLVPEHECQFAGTTPLERATILSWLAFLSGTIHGQGYGALWRPARFIDGEKFPGGEQAVQEAGRRNLGRLYGQVERRLAEGGKSEFAVRDGQPTAVDWYLYLFWHWGKSIGIAMDEGAYPKWTRVVKAVEGREATRRVGKSEGLGLLFADVKN